MRIPKHLITPPSTPLGALPAVTLALAAAGLISTANAQLQTAGSLLVNVDATTLAEGSLPSIPNAGTMGGFFEARGGADQTPLIAPVSAGGTKGIRFDGNDFLQHVGALGGEPISADPGLTGSNPSSSVEVWVLNPTIPGEETLVSWGHRGGPDGSNMAFNYGNDARWGAVGHWGGPDLGWEASENGGAGGHTPVAGRWHHLVYTYDGTTQRVYADGVLKNSENVSLNIHAVPAINIGAQYDDDTVVTGGLRTSATIARVRIHQDALTAAQVLNNYNFEKADFVGEVTSYVAVAPIHRYRFSNAAGTAADETAIQDSIGTAHGTVQGTGATFNGSRIALPGGAPTGPEAYIDLPNGLLSANSIDRGGSGQITFEGWNKTTGVQSWARIMDIGMTTGGELAGPGGGGEGRDYLFYAASEGTSQNRHNVTIRNIEAPTGPEQGVGYDTANYGNDFHWAITWDEVAGFIRVYENGNEVAAYDVDETQNRFSTINDVNVWLGRSNWAPNDNKYQGEYDEFRIYNKVLTAEEVARSAELGAAHLHVPGSAPIIETQPKSLTIMDTFGATASFAAETRGQAPISFQWYKNNAPVAGATANSLTLPISTADNGAQFYLVAANGIGGSVTSSVAVLTVNPDTAPPVILGTGGGPGWGLDETHFGMRFNEPVNKADAENLANYSASGGVTLSSAVLQSDNVTVLFTSSSIKGFGAKELTVSNIRDRASAQNPIPAGTKVGIVYAEGSMRYEQFNEIGGGVNVSDVLNNAKFPNSPDVIQNVTQFENPAGSAGQGDNYGSRFQGFLTAPVSGDYVFYIAADDGAALWLSTDASPAHKVQIAREPIWSGFRTYTGAANGGGRVCPGPDCNISPAVPLQGGARYYVEMIYKEGIGGDFGSVAWQTPASGPSPGVPAIGSAPIQGGYLSPFNVAPTINQDVADVTILNGRKATFVSDIFGTSPITYQWYLNGNPIEGATGTSYTTDYQYLPDDNGATFYVVAQNNLGTVQSRTASLTINPDNTAPTLIGAVGSATFDSVTIQFSEPVTDSSAADPFEWSISGGGGPLGVDNAVLSADGMTLVLTTAMQTENTLYTVTAGGQTEDLAGNAIAGGASINFRSYVTGGGGVLFESFLGIGGNLVADLTAHPSFPNSPSERFLISDFNSRLAYPDDSHEGYGARMRAVFIPPSSGNWVFFMAADDGSQLKFNPNGPNAAGAQVLLTRDACCGDYASANSQSAPQALIGGQGYYIEMLYKEGGGGDWGQLAARLQGTGTPPLTEIIPGGQLGFPAAPPGVAGEITIAQQPASTTVFENTPFTFSVVASNPNSLPMSYQWFKDGVAITGATGPTYSRLAVPADNGGVYTVEIAMIGNRVTSGPATLTVSPDTTAPTLVSGKAGDFLDRITIKFSELMANNASDPFVYTISPNASIADAVLQADGMTVLITLSEGVILQENTQYTVTVGSGVTDLASSPNPVAAGSSVSFRSLGFTAGFINFKAYHGSTTPTTAGQIPGNLVSDLVAHPSFPNNPTETFVIPGFNSRFAYPNDAHETYGATMTGLFVPPASGNYVFYMAADDGSQLKFNPTGPTPGGAQVLLTRDACCGDYTSANSQSLPQALVAGQRYYIEMLYKEGGGGDWGQVAVRLEGQAIPPIGEIIDRANIGSYQDVSATGINITQQPVDALKVIDPNNPGVNPNRTFSVTATSGTQPVFYRWQRNNGAGYFDVAFSTSSSYTLDPSLADNGAKFRVIISAPGSEVTSAEATLTVVQLNTAPQFTLQATTATTEDSGPQTVAGFATGILPHSIARTPITLNYDFSSVPSGVVQENRQNDAPSTLPLIRDGILKITDAVNGSLGGFATPSASGLRIESFTLDFNLRVGGGTCCGAAIPEGTSRMADGLSISFGNNVAPSSGEEGSGSGLIVSFDLWDNGGLDDPATAPNVDVKWAGAIVPNGYQAFAGEREGGRAPSGPLINDPATGSPMTMLTGSGFAPVRVHMDADGTVDVDFKGVRVLNNIPTPYEAILGPRIAISGRTGGANANQWIDDLKLEAFPTDSSSAENGQVVSFLVSSDNPSLFSAQPAIASNGALTYTTAPNACGLATVTVVAQDNGGTANGGSDTSAAKTFTIDIACVNDCPTAGSQTVAANAGTPKSITLVGSDVDGNALTYAITQAPAHGVVVLQAQTGAATYTATAGYEGPDSFSYTVSDGTCVSAAPGIVTINVTGVANTAPTAKIVATPLLDFSPSITHKVIISGDGNEACLKLDGSLSSDAESPASALTYLWFIEPSPLPFASGVVVSNYCLELGTHTILLAVTDPQGLTGTDSLTVEVLTVGEAIEELITRVNDSNVARKNKRPFIASLKAAAASADRGNDNSAANQLHAFQNKVRAQVGKENPAEAAVWIRWAQDIIDAME